MAEWKKQTMWRRSNRKKTNTVSSLRENGHCQAKPERKTNKKNGNTPLFSSGKQKNNHSTHRGKQQSPLGKSTKRTGSSFCLHLLPPDVFAVVLPFLTSKETNAMVRVCSAWSSIVLQMKQKHVEWKNTILTALSVEESLKLLRMNHGNCFLTRFAPNFVIISIGCSDTTPWQTGGYWKDLVLTLESAKLIPAGCLVVGLFSPLGVMGSGSVTVCETQRFTSQSRRNADASSKVITLSITVAHLPGTTIEAATFDRVSLRQHARGRSCDFAYPFTAVDNGDVPSFLTVCVNENSAEELLPILRQWDPMAPVVGGVLSSSGQFVPVVSYSRTGCSFKHCGEMRTRRQQRQNQAKRQQDCRGEMDFPENLVIQFRGRIGIHPFGSCAYQPVTSVIQSKHVPSRELNYLADPRIFYLISEPDEDGFAQDRSLVVPPEFQTLEYMDALAIYACSEPEPLRSILNPVDDAEVMWDSAANVSIRKLDGATFDFEGAVFTMTQHWEERMYGFLAILDPSSAKRAHIRVLQQIQHTMELHNERPIGAFMIGCAFKRKQSTEKSGIEVQAHSTVFPEIPLSCCLSAATIGPIAIPGGLMVHPCNQPAQVQNWTTCGVIFFEKPT